MSTQNTEMKKPDESEKLSEFVTFDFFMETIQDSLSESGFHIEKIDLSEFQSNEPVEILVELSKAGKIDPWNIDIVRVTDSFLQRVEEMKMMDLRISGRTLLYSCILLKMKSLELTREEMQEEDIWDENDWEDPLEFNTNDFEIPKMPIRRSAKRPVTLQELIDELKKAEKTATKRREREQKKEIAVVEPELTTEDVLNIAHDEAILKRTQALLSVLNKWFKTKEYVTLEDVFLLPDGDRVMDYVTLLFLTTMREIMLVQEVIFSDIKIYPPVLEDEELKESNET